MHAIRIRLGTAVVLFLAVATSSGGVSGEAASPPPWQDAIAYRAIDGGATSLMVTSVEGGEPQELWYGPFVQDYSWSSAQPVLAANVLGIGMAGTGFEGHLFGPSGSDTGVGGRHTRVGPWLGVDVVVTTSTPTSSELSVAHANGDVVRQLAVPQGFVTAMAATADASSLAATWADDVEGRANLLSVWTGPDWSRQDVDIAASSFAWSPDGATIAVTSGSDVIAVDVASLEQRVVATTSDPGVLPVDVRWSGDGTRLVVVFRGTTDIVSVPASAEAIDLASQDPEIVRLASDVPADVWFADGPSDAPLAWFSYGSSMPWETSTTFRSGIISADGSSARELTSIIGNSPLLSWDASATRLAISQDGGLGVLDVASDEVTTVVPGSERFVLDARWQRTQR